MGKSPYWRRELSLREVSTVLLKPELKRKQECISCNFKLMFALSHIVLVFEFDASGLGVFVVVILGHYF